jgi:uncharacterized protein YcbK (DUF882 family)
MNTKHFKEREFRCKCTKCKVRKSQPVPIGLVAILELVRLKFGSAVTITSSQRCEEHNKTVGGSDRSQHKLCTAADIKVRGIEPQEVYSFLDSLFPDNLGLGLYYRMGKRFVHVDIREGKARWIQ